MDMMHFINWIDNWLATEKLRYNLFRCFCGLH